MRGRAATIYLGLPLLGGSSGQPGDGPGTLSPLLGLAPNGVCPASDVTTGAVSSYLAISPLSARGGRYVSVALSVGSPRPAVSGHPTRRSSDFPPSPLAATSRSEERPEETRGTAAARPPCAVPIVPSSSHRRHLMYPPRAAGRACEYDRHTLRQAQGERSFPFVVSLSNHSSPYFSQAL